MMRDFMMDDSMGLDISDAKDIELSDDAQAKLAEIFADIDSETTPKAA